MKRNRPVTCLAIAGLVALLGLMALCTVIAVTTYLAPATPAPAEQARSGQAAQDIGLQPVTFGSRGQAQALLALIDAQPGRVDYRITYQTPDDNVIFGCNFEHGVIIRIHQRPGGSGTQETWSGYIMERLRSAAAGGSLNDTPDGNQPGTHETF